MTDTKKPLYQDLISSEHQLNIKALQAKYLADKDTDDYLVECASKTISVLTYFMGKNLVFFNFFNFDTIKKDFSSLLNELDTKGHLKFADKEVVKLIKTSNHIIANSTIYSFTKLLIGKEISGVFFTNDKTEYEKIQNKDWVNVLYSDEFEEKFKELSSNNKLLKIYKSTNLDDYLHPLRESLNDEYIIATLRKFGEESTAENIVRLKNTLIFHRHYLKFNENFYGYCIRPRVIHHEYGGMYYIATKQPFLSLDLDALSLDLKNVTSETATNRIKQITQDVEWKDISNMKAHTLRHYIGAKQGVMDKLKSYYDKNNLGEADALFQTIKGIDSFIGDSFNLQFALQKIDWKYENLVKIKDEVTKDTLKIQSFSLPELLSNCLNMLRYSLKIYGFDADRQKKVEAMLSNLSDNIKTKMFGLRLNAVRIVFETIVQDILKNAVKHTDEANPDFKMSLVDFDKKWIGQKNRRKLVTGIKYVALVFENNTPLSAEDYKYLSNPITDTLASFSKSVRLGIKNVHKFLQYDGISQQAANNPHKPKWLYLPANESNTPSGYTKTFLIIPKEDII